MTNAILILVVKMNVNVETVIDNKLTKYDDLVWYARKTAEDRANNADCNTECLRIETTYPNECIRLNDPDAADWEHGFNSGMLAALRYVASYLTNDPVEIEFAERSFPYLDA